MLVLLKAKEMPTRTKSWRPALMASPRPGRIKSLPDLDELILPSFWFFDINHKLFMRICILDALMF